MTRSALTLCWLVFLAGCQVTPTQFALVGDSPYLEENLPKYERMIERINESGDIDWVVHLGDMKSGVGNCRDEDFERLYRLNQQFEPPFVLTPGDNDWFDCKREPAGSWGRLDRLDKLREIFYSEPSALPLVSQGGSGLYGDFVENVYWQDSGVVFAMVHLTGVTGTEGGMALHYDIQNAAVEWLGRVFEVAASTDAAGVFIATQADMYPFSGERSWLAAVCPECSAPREYYEKFHEALLGHALQFERPILLAVGDTHVFRVDKPLYDGDVLVEHFTRVEGFGEDDIHWVRVIVRPETHHVFEIHQEIIPENIRQRGEK